MEDLLKAIFYKAGKHLGKPDNKTAMSEYLSSRLSATGNGPIGSKTLVRQYDRYILNLEKAQQNAPPSTDHLNAYAMFLGYKNYSDYLVKTEGRNYGNEKTGSASSLDKINIGTAIQQQTNIENQTTIGTQNIIEKQDNTRVENQTINNNTETPESKKRSKNTYFIVIFIAIVVSITLYIIYVKNNEKLCLVWKENRFESAECSSISESEKSISVNPDEWGDKYKNFRKINVTQATTFYGKNGKPAVWYSKRNGNYDFFNEPGYHPLTGKELQPINQTVIEAYFKTQENDNDDANTSDLRIEPEKTSDVSDQSNPSSEIKEVNVIEAKKGKYCFKNQLNKGIRVSINSSNQPVQNIDLNSNEQICLQLPLEKYNFSASVSGQNSAFKKGTFFVSENREGSISLSIPEEKTTSTQPVTTPTTQPIKTEATKDLTKGDFCIKNTTSSTLDIRIGNKTDGPLGSNYYFFLTVQPGGKECYYDIPAVAYNVQYYFNGEMQHLKYSQLRVKGGETGEKIF